MTVLFDSPSRSSLALNVVADDGQIVHARVDGRLAHRFPLTPRAVATTVHPGEPDSISESNSVNTDSRATLAKLRGFDEPLANAIGSDAYQRRVLLNLSSVTGMDTSGVNWLLTVQKRMDAAGGRLVLHSLSPAARNVVRVLKLHGALRVAVDESDAVQRM